MGWKSYVGVTVAVGAIGFLAGFVGGVYCASPSSVCEKMVEGDDRRFLVIKDNLGVRTPMVENSSGEYFIRIGQARIEAGEDAEKEFSGLSREVLKVEE